MYRPQILLKMNMHYTKQTYHSTVSLKDIIEIPLKIVTVGLEA